MVTHNFKMYPKMERTKTDFELSYNNDKEVWELWAIMNFNNGSSMSQSIECSFTDLLDLKDAISNIKTLYDE